MENSVTNSKYPKGVIITHWLTLILLAVVFYKGTTLEHFEFNEANINQYRSHAILGMLIVFVTFIRIIIKRKNINNLPQEIEFYSTGHKTFVETIYKLIYALLILTPLVGFVMVYQTGALAYDLGGAFPEGAEFNETLETLHKVFVFSLLGLIIIHVFGIVIYYFKKGENLIKRMCLLLK